MKILESIAFAIGTPLLLIGTGAIIVFIVISYNERSLQTLAITYGIIAVILGLLLIKYGTKTNKRGVFDIIFSLLP